MSTESLDTSVGARLWYEGAAWTVVQLEGTTALLRSADRLLRGLSICLCERGFTGRG